MDHSVQKARNASPTITAGLWTEDAAIAQRSAKHRDNTNPLSFDTPISR